MDEQSEMRRILLVEDNPGDVGLLRLALERAQVDCELTVLGDGVEALELVATARKVCGRPAAGTGDT